MEPLAKSPRPQRNSPTNAHTHFIPSYSIRPLSPVLCPSRSNCTKAQYYSLKPHVNFSPHERPQSRQGKERMITPRPAFVNEARAAGRRNEDECSAAQRKGPECSLRPSPWRAPTAGPHTSARQTLPLRTLKMAVEDRLTLLMQFSASQLREVEAR